MVLMADAQRTPGTPATPSVEHGSWFQALFESAAIGIAVIDTEGRPVQANAAFLDMFGYTAEEMHRMSFRDVTYPADLEADLEMRERLIRGEQAYYRLDKRYVRKGGELMWGRLTVSLIRDPLGAPSHAIATVEDVTDSVLARAALEDRTRRLAALHAIERKILTAGSLEAVVQAGLAHATELVSCDRASVALFLPTGEARVFAIVTELETGVDAGTLVPREELAAMMERLERHEPFVLEDARAAGELRGLLRTLTEEGLRSIISWPMVAQGELVGAFNVAARAPHAFTRDHREAVEEFADSLALAVVDARLREAEQERTHELERLVSELTRAKENYRTLVEQLPAVVYVNENDDPTTAVYVSSYYETLLGYTAAERMADPGLWDRLLHPDDRDRVLEESLRVGETGDPLSMDYRMVRKDGRTVWVHEEGRAIFDQDGLPTRWQGVLLDVTDLQNAQEELRRSHDLLRDAAEAQRRLLTSLVSAQEAERRRVASDVHDDSIQAMTTVGLRLAPLRRALSTDEDALRNLGEAERSVSHSIDRLRRLLFELHPTGLDLPGGLRAVLRAALGVLTEDVDLTTRLDYRLPDDPSSEARTICYRIVQEALANVRKHARAANLAISLEQADRGVLVRVQDDGIGFLTDGIQVDREHLGLPSMRERAELAGGWFRVDSEPGRGTTVEFWIPDLPAARP